MRKKALFGRISAFLMAVIGVIINLTYTFFDTVPFIQGITYQKAMIIGNILLVGAFIMYMVKYECEFANTMPLVKLSEYDETEGSVELINGTIERKDIFAYVKIRNQPKNMHKDALSENVFAKLSYFKKYGEEFIRIYQDQNALWIPPKHTKPSWDQVSQNNNIVLPPTGEEKTIYLLYTKYKNGTPITIENCIEYFENKVFEEGTQYFEHHFLTKGEIYYVFLELRGTRLNLDYLFEFCSNENGLNFKNIMKRRILRKIKAMKKK